MLFELLHSYKTDATCSFGCCSNWETGRNGDAGCPYDAVRTLTLLQNRCDVPVRMLFELGDCKKWATAGRQDSGISKKTDSSAIVQQIPILLGFLHV